MPHRVTNFFRSSSNSVDNLAVTNLKDSARSRNRSSSSRSRTRNGARDGAISDRSFSYASSIDSDVEDHSSRSSSNSPSTAATTPHRLSPSPSPQLLSVPKMMATAAASVVETAASSHHRLSFVGLHLPGRSSRPEMVNPSAGLGWKIESPPIVLHGDAESSTGALVSGQLVLDVREEPFEVEAFEATLQLHVLHRKPFQTHCNDCANQYTTLKKWSFLSQPIALTQDTHNYPFSVLMPGHLPATTDGPVTAISYEFKAELTAKNGPAIKFERTLTVSRALPPAETPHHSLRVFPPTNIAASVHYPHAIHPIGANTMQLRLSGMVKRNPSPEVRTIEYWKLKRLTWRIDEVHKTVAPACDKHAPRDTPGVTPQPSTGRKGLARTETRAVGGKELTDGWKVNYNAATGSGEVELELPYFCTPPDHREHHNSNSGASTSTNPSPPHRHVPPMCDVRARDGTEVTHSLVVEMVVVQEMAPIGTPRHVTPTGLARILRMHFATVVTERAGLGVSWDNEAPPIYQDVPPSPPAYVEEIWGEVEQIEARAAAVGGAGAGAPLTTATTNGSVVGAAEGGSPGGSSRRSSGSLERRAS